MVENAQDAAARAEAARVAREKQAAKEALRRAAAAEGVEVGYDALGEEGYAGVSYARRGAGEPPYKATLSYFYANGKARSLFLGFHATAEDAALCVARAKKKGVGGLQRKAPIPLPAGGRLEVFGRMHWREVGSGEGVRPEKA